MSGLLVILIIGAIVGFAWLISGGSPGGRRLEKLENEVRAQRREIDMLWLQLARLRGLDAAPEQSMEDAGQAAPAPEGENAASAPGAEAPGSREKPAESPAASAAMPRAVLRGAGPSPDKPLSDDKAQDEPAAPEHAPGRAAEEPAPVLVQPRLETGGDGEGGGKGGDGGGWNISRLEETFGAYWTIWAGALALGLGAIFLSAYAVARITFTPAMRIGSGVLFSLALLAAGEYLRRNDARFRLNRGNAAYIPGGLTAAGISGLYAAIYAGHASYGFFGPAPAFLLLAAASLGALALALMHGPLLAALGIVGAYAVPFLVSSSAPNFWVLAIYLLFISAAALMVARRRAWVWMEYTVAAAVTLWGLIWLSGWTDGAQLPVSVFLLGHAGLFLWPGGAAREAAEETGKRPLPDEAAWLSGMLSGALAGLTGLAFLALFMLAGGHHGPVPLATAGAVFILMAGASIMRGDLRLALPVAAITVLLSVASWNGAHGLESIVRHALNAPDGALRALPEGSVRLVLFAMVMAAVLAASGLSGALRRGGDILSAAVSALAPLALHVTLWGLLGLPGHRMAFFAAALIGAGAAAAATLVCDARLKERAGAMCGGMYAAAGVAFTALALGAVLRHGWLTVALSLMAPALAWIGARRAMPVMRWLTAAVIGLVGLRLLADPLFLAMNVGTMPVFNWLLAGYGAPAAAFALAARIMRKEREDIFSDLAEAAAVVLAAALASLELHHYLNGGNMRAADFPVSEKALHSLVWLSMAAAYQYIAARNERRVPKLAALAFGYIGLAMVLIGHVVLFNPLLTNDSIGGGFVFNMLLLLHALPALFLYALGRLALARRQENMGIIAMGGAAFLLFMWISELVRVFFHPGGHIGLRLGVQQGELYAYSLVWLICAVGLLAAASMLKNGLLRAAGMALVALVAGKVFIIDMAGLHGILRALSFIGLGIVLMGIGWAYQRVFAQDRDTPEETSGETARKSGGRE